jgi:hypothetical protein
VFAAVLLALSTTASAAAPGPAGPAGATRAPAESDITLKDAVVEISAGSAEGADTLLLKFPSGAVAAGAPQVRDLDPALAARWGLSFSPAPGPRDGEARTWVVLVSAGKLPRNTDQERYLSVRWGDFSAVAPYRVRNTAPAPFAWDVDAATGEVTWEGPVLVELTAQVGAVPADPVRLVSATLLEEKTRRAFDPKGLKLCPDDADCAGAAFRLEANNSYRLTVRRISDAGPAPGEYVGSIVVAGGGAEAKTFPLRVHVTGFWWKFLGLLLILAGVAGALLTTVFIRHRLMRAHRLWPAALLTEQLTSVRNRLDAHPTVGDASRARVEALLEELSEARLEARRFVPPRIPAPWSASTQDTAAAYQTFLDGVAAWATVLAVISSGFSAVEAEEAREPPPDPAKVATVLAAIDALSSGPVAPTEEAARTAVAQQLASLRAPGGARALRAGLAGLRRLEAARPLSLRQVRSEAAALSLTGWAITALLSVLAGFLALVLMNPAFGQGSDLIACLLWGFGVPLAGQQLSQLSTSSVTRALGVDLPAPPSG